MTKSDRRVQRTRELLQNAFIDLVSERGYDAITVQDITDRANVGRTTFYLHFNGKDELFMSVHDSIVSGFNFEPMSREELLSPHAPAGFVALYKHGEAAYQALYPILQGKDGALLLRRLRQRVARTIEDSLRQAFAEEDSAIPFHLLANYLAGAELTLVQWWIEKRQPYPAEELAQTFHRLQRAAICDALGLTT